MDSALCLPFGSLPTLPLHFHINKSTTTRLLLTKPHSTFNPSPLSSFPNGSGFRRQQRQTFSNVVFAMDRLSKPATNENRGGNHEIARGTVGASLVLACAVAMMGCSSKLSPKAFAATFPPTPPELTDALFTNKGALNSLLDTTVKLASPDVQSIRVSEMLDSFTRPRKGRRPSKDDVDKLKLEAVKLMKAGKGQDAVAKLGDLYKRVKGDPEPEYFVGMALVEILIAQGKYEDALRCDCLKDDHPKEKKIADARFYLYKAILCTMTGNDDEARIYWKKFTGQGQDDRSGGPNRREKDDRPGPPTQEENDDQSGGFFPFSFHFNNATYL